MKPHQMMTIAVQLERDLADFYKHVKLVCQINNIANHLPAVRISPGRM